MTHARRKLVESLWQTIYMAFENAVTSPLQTVTATNQQRSQVQFRMQRATARLQHVKTVSEEDTKELRADIMLAETVGWLGADTAKKALDLLDQIENR